MPIKNEPQQIDLSVINAPAPTQAQPDPKAIEEERVYDAAKREIEVEGLRQDLAERKNYAKRIFVLICAWLAGVGILLLLQGFFSRLDWFSLSDAVILAAIGGTTVNVLGIFIIVVNYLFPKR